MIGRYYGLLNPLGWVDDFLQSDSRDKPTIADVAAYTYLSHAPEGNVALTGYRRVNSWLSSIESLPRVVGMQRTAKGLQEAYVQGHQVIRSSGHHVAKKPRKISR